MTTPITILTLQIRLASDPLYVRQIARDIAEALGFARNDQTRIATAVSEIARNAWQYAGGGEVEFRMVPAEPQLFETRIQDQGPGFREEESGNAAGNGLAGARAVMDSFAIDHAGAAGTTVVMGKTLPPDATVWDAATLHRIAAEIAERPAQSPVEELHRQNQELLRTLHQIREQEALWKQLYREMEETNRDMLAIHTEMSGLNQALGQSETRSRLMVEVQDYAILLLNPEGGIVTWNIGAERILGFTQARTSDASGEIIFAPEDLQNGVPAQEMRTARETGRAEAERWQMRADGSRFWANSVMTALRENESLIGYVKIIRDVTEQKKAQDALREAYERERHITEVLQSPLLKKSYGTALPTLSVVTFYESNLNEAEVGGDFFDGFLVKDGHVALAVGDASGKGLAAAVRAIKVKELLRATFALLNENAPAPVVTRLNQYLCEDDQNPAAEGFVTLALVVVNPATCEGLFLCAGCEPPLVVRASGAPAVLEASGAPLGVTGDAQYRAFPFSFRPGDTLVLLTDGITEARHQGEFLEYGGMVRLAQAGMSLPLEEMGQNILEGARAFAHGRFRDDVCLLLARLPEPAA